MVELFRSPRRLLLFAFEGTLVAILVIVGACLRFGVHEGLTVPNVAKKALLVALVLQGCFYYAGLYELGATRAPRAVYDRVIRGLVLGALVLFLAYYLVPELEIHQSGRQHGRGV